MSFLFWLNLTVIRIWSSEEVLWKYQKWTNLRSRVMLKSIVNSEFINAIYENCQSKKFVCLSDYFEIFVKRNMIPFDDDAGRSNLVRINKQHLRNYLQKLGPPRDEGLRQIFRPTFDHRWNRCEPLDEQRQAEFEIHLQI